MKAISSMATRHVLADLLTAAVDAGLSPIDVESFGGVNGDERVAAGEQLDLVILASAALETLADSGHVDAATVVPLMLSHVAVAVASDSSERPSARAPERPKGAAFADAAGMQAALRAANRIGYSTGLSGTALVRLIEE